MGIPLLQGREFDAHDNRQSFSADLHDGGSRGRCLCAAAIQHAALRRVRVRGFVAGRDRDLRRNRLLGGSAHTRDRHPHGPRRYEPRRALVGKFAIKPYFLRSCRRSKRAAPYSFAKASTSAPIYLQQTFNTRAFQFMNGIAFVFITMILSYYKYPSPDSHNTQEFYYIAYLHITVGYNGPAVYNRQFAHLIFQYPALKNRKRIAIRII